MYIRRVSHEATCCGLRAAQNVALCTERLRLAHGDCALHRAAAGLAATRRRRVTSPGRQLMLAMLNLRVRKCWRVLKNWVNTYNSTILICSDLHPMQLANYVFINCCTVRFKCLRRFILFDITIESILYFVSIILSLVIFQKSAACRQTDKYLFVVMY